MPYGILCHQVLWRDTDFISYRALSSCDTQYNSKVDLKMPLLPCAEAFPHSFPPVIRSPKSHVSTDDPAVTRVSGFSTVNWSWKLWWLDSDGFVAPLWFVWRLQTEDHFSAHLYRMMNIQTCRLHWGLGLNNWMMNTNPRPLLYLMDQTVRRSNGGLFNAANPVSTLLFRAQTLFYIPHLIRSIETRKSISLLLWTTPVIYASTVYQLGFRFLQGGGCCRSSACSLWDKESSANQITPTCWLVIDLIISFVGRWLSVVVSLSSGAFQHSHFKPTSWSTPVVWTSAFTVSSDYRPSVISLAQFKL